MDLFWFSIRAKISSDKFLIYNRGYINLNQNTHLLWIQINPHITIRKVPYSFIRQKITIPIDEGWISITEGYHILKETLKRRQQENRDYEHHP